MPHLVQMDKKYRNKGLTLIGADVQGTSEDGIKEFAKQHKVEFALTKGTSTPSDLRGIPHMVVFGPSGEKVFAGHPSSPDAEKAIKDALKDVAEDALAAPGGGGEPDGGGFGLASRKADLIAERAWTNSKGQTMTAALVSLEGNTATFRLKNGTSVPYDIANLSEADQAAIREAAAPAAEKEE